MTVARAMLRRCMRSALVVLISCAALDRASAQDTTATAGLRPTAEGQVVILRLRDGSTLLGRVVEVTPSSVRFASSLGESTIPRGAIAAVKPVRAEDIHDGQLWPEDPSRTRLFFAPTGRTLRKGELYFADAYIFFASLQGGLTDRITVGGGASLFPGISIDKQLFYLTPKVGVYASPNVNLAVGALIAGVKGLSDESPFGIGYGVGTFGSENSSVTVGAGFGFAGSEASSQALLMLGGQHRVSRTIALVSENYYLSGSGSDVGLSGGVRFMSEHIAVDLALVTATGASGAVPYVSFIYKW